MTLRIRERTKGLIDILETDLSLNSVNDRSTTIDLGSLSNIIFDFAITSGVLGSAVLRLECSCDSVKFFDVDTEITVVGLYDNYTIKTRYVRIYVQTASGSEATFSLHINIKI